MIWVGNRKTNVMMAVIAVRETLNINSLER